MYMAADLPGTMVCIFCVLNIFLSIAGATTAVSIWTVSVRPSVEPSTHPTDMVPSSGPSATPSVTPSTHPSDMIPSDPSVSVRSGASSTHHWCLWDPFLDSVPKRWRCPPIRTKLRVSFRLYLGYPFLSFLEVSFPLEVFVLSCSSS